MPRFKPRETSFLFFEIDLTEQFNEKTLEYMLSDFVDNYVDMNRFEEAYNNDEKGQTAIHSSIILKVIFYSFMNGIQSTREMERLTKRNLAYKFLTGNIEIDHTTIAKFMMKHRKAIEDVFSELLIVFNDIGLIDWSVIVTDGVRITANAAKELTGDEKDLERKLGQFHRLANRLVERSERLEKIESKKEREGERIRVERQMKRYKNVIRKIEKHKEKIKKKEIDGKKKINLTDEDSSLLRTEKGFIQGYNVQVSMSKNDIIVGIEARSEKVDSVLTEELVKKVEGVKEELGVKEESKHLMDKGYFDTEKMTNLMKEGISLFIPIPSYAKNLNEIEKMNIEKVDGEVYLVSDKKKIKGSIYKSRDKEVYTFKGLENGKKKNVTITKTVVDNIDMWVKYKKEAEKPEWKDIYNKRIGKEHNFDTLKNQMGFSKIWRRGREKATFEAKLFAIAFNLRKLFQFMSKNELNFGVFGVS